MLTGPTLTPKNPKQALLLLHGFGSNGDDLMGLAQPLEAALPAEKRNQTAYFSPHAPLELPFGGYAWFSDNNWTFRDRDGIETAKDLLWNYIETNIFTLGLSAKDVTVLGFSQGAMTALFAAPRWPESVAGIIAHSGRLMWEEELTTATTCHKPPALILHGTADDVVPALEADNAYTNLKELNFPVTKHTIPQLGHGVNEVSLDYIAKFLKNDD